MTVVRLFVGTKEGLVQAVCFPLLARRWLLIDGIRDGGSRSFALVTRLCEVFCQARFKNALAHRDCCQLPETDACSVGDNAQAPENESHFLVKSWPFGTMLG